MEIRLTDGESFNIKGGDGLKVDGQSVGGSVEVVAPNASAVEGQAADAKKTYEALEKKYDKPATSTIALGANAETGDADGTGVGAIAIGENAKSQITGSVAIGQNAEATGPFPLASCLVAIGADAKATPNEPIVIGSDATAITAKAKVVVTKDGVMTIGGKEVAMAENIPAAPDLTEYAKTAEVLPRYRFVDAEIVDGKVTIAPYTNTKIASDGTEFTVAVGDESGYMRDCVLRVECGETAPKITWGNNFHPRTGAETDFSCVANVRNVYWITEHAEGEFCVAGWQETTGGNAS